MHSVRLLMAAVVLANGTGLVAGTAVADSESARLVLSPPGAGDAPDANRGLEEGGALDLKDIAQELKDLGGRALDSLVWHDRDADMHGGGHALEPGYAEFGVKVPVREGFSFVPAYSVTSPDEGITLGDDLISKGFRFRARYNF